MNNKSRLCIFLATTVAAGTAWRAWRSKDDAGHHGVTTPAAGPEGALSATLAAAQRTGGAKALADLRTALLSMDRGRATAWITGRLASGEDFSTGQDFAPGQDGTLTAWPALRVFLLDTLYLMDPAAAANAGRKILQSPTTPDEWALAMRNVGAGSPSAEDVMLLKTKSAEMLRNETWQKAGSAGYLEAFDVIVHRKNVALSPELISLTADTANKPVRHAAFLTLDRLTLADPAAMLEKLIPSAAAQPETALMVSNMIARADVRDPEQRKLVEGYLKGPSLPS